jgi:Dimerisation domain
MSAVTPQSQKPPAHAGIFQLFGGISIAGAISCLAQLAIPDLVENGPKSADELAREVGADSRALYRLMRATASVGVLSESADGKFSETPMSAVLRSNAKPSLRAFAIMHGTEWHAHGWARLDYCVKTGKQALDEVYGMPLFQFFAQHPEVAQVFDQAMSDLSSLDSPAVADAYSSAKFTPLLMWLGDTGDFWRRLWRGIRN